MFYQTINYKTDTNYVFTILHIKFLKLLRYKLFEKLKIINNHHKIDHFYSFNIIFIIYINKIYLNE